MQTQRNSAAQSVEHFVMKLRRRALLLTALHTGTAGLGAAMFVFACAAASVGPLSSLPESVIAWTATAAAFGAACWYCLGPALHLQGPSAARLLGRVSASLASATRTALELGSTPVRSGVSHPLVIAHAESVRAQLGHLSPRHVVPVREIARPSLAMGVLGLLAGALAVTSIDRVSAGAFALTHPSIRDASGSYVASIVRSMEARLVFPSYMKRPPRMIAVGSEIEAPKGTSVELTVRTRIAAHDGRVDVLGVPAALRMTGPYTLVGSFVVRKSGPFEVHTREKRGRWLHDPTTRRINARSDTRPELKLRAVSEKAAVEPHDNVELGFEAEDDVGLVDVDLVVTNASGRTFRRNLRSFDAMALKTRVRGIEPWVPAEFGARPGDSLRLWLEGRDGDLVSGPNIGRSQTLTVSIASDATRNAEVVATLQAATNQMVDSLADRLDADVPKAPQESRKRSARIQAGLRTLLGHLDAAARSLSKQSRGVGRGVAYPMVMGIRRRASTTLDKEERNHALNVAPEPQRRAADEHATRELESDTLLLADLLGRARIEDAATVTRELERARKELTGLLQRYRSAKTEQAKAELLAAVSRAEARMRELMNRLSAMSTSVPGEFVNTDSLPAQTAASSLAQMRDAVNRGDIDAAERQLNSLGRDIERIARALGGADQRFAEQRFGPREKAMSEALGELERLEHEQRKLAGRAGELRRSAAEKAAKSMAGAGNQAAKKVLQKTHAARSTLDKISRSQLGSMERETLERARQRLRDAEDALRSGDLNEAREMADEASDSARDLARELGLSALMFPGHDGQMAKDAALSKEAAKRMQDVLRSIDEGMPNLGGFVSSGDRRHMLEQAHEQAGTRQGAHKLEERMANGPDGVPLSPDAASGLRSAQKSMSESERWLREGDPSRAARAQEEAAQKLSELRSSLEPKSGQSGSSSESGGQESAGSQFDFRQPVRIPGRDENRSSSKTRRQLLDAMKERAPLGFEASVRRYYEELLR